MKRKGNKGTEAIKPKKEIPFPVLENPLQLGTLTGIYLAIADCLWRRDGEREESVLPLRYPSYSHRESPAGSRDT